MSEEINLKNQNLWSYILKADECADLAGADVQAEILHGRLAAVGLGQMFDVEHKVPSFVRGSAPLCP